MGIKMNTQEKMFRIADECRQNAYAPYSHYKVGAAVLSTEGEIFGGCNVENISFPCGTCAEAGAIAAMIAAGHTKIAEILICSDDPDIIPCGNCLQKIAEFADPTTIISCATPAQTIRRYTLRQLLPKTFVTEI